MRICLLLCMIFLFACESHTFDSDKRQIIAKDEVRKLLRGRGSQFDVVSFRQDTLTNYSDTQLQNPIRYTLQFKYLDTDGQLTQETAYVLFTKNGLVPLSTQIVNQP